MQYALIFYDLQLILARMRWAPHQHRLCRRSPVARRRDMEKNGPEMPRPPRGHDPREGRSRAWGGGWAEDQRAPAASVGRAGLLPGAGLDAASAAPLRLGPIPPHDVPRLVTLWADQPADHPAWDAWRAAHRVGWRLAGKARPAGTPGVNPLEQRGVMERTYAWHGRYHRSNTA